MNQKVMILIAKQVQECCKKSPDGKYWSIKIGVKMIVDEANITDIQAEI